MKGGMAGRMAGGYRLLGKLPFAAEVLCCLPYQRVLVLHRSRKNCLRTIDVSTIAAAHTFQGCNSGMIYAASVVQQQEGCIGDH